MKGVDGNEDVGSANVRGPTKGGERTRRTTILGEATALSQWVVAVLMMP